MNTRSHSRRPFWNTKRPYRIVKLKHNDTNEPAQRKTGKMTKSTKLFCCVENKAFHSFHSMHIGSCIFACCRKLCVYQCICAFHLPIAITIVIVIVISDEVVKHYFRKSVFVQNIAFNWRKSSSRLRFFFFFLLFISRH